MFGFMKTMMTIVGLALIVVGVVAILLYTRANRFAADAVEDQLRHAFETNVTLDSISVAPLRRSIEIRNLVVMNPEGFQETPALEVENLSLELVPRTLFGERPVIKRMKMTGTDVYYRHELGQGLNIARLISATASGDGTAEGPRFVVEDFLCEEAEVHLSSNLLPASRVGLNVVTIHETNLTSDEPLTSRQISNIFVRSLLRETLTLKGLLNPAVNMLERELKRLTGGDDAEEEPASEPEPKPDIIEPPI